MIPLSVKPALRPYLNARLAPIEKPSKIILFGKKPSSIILSNNLSIKLKVFFVFQPLSGEPLNHVYPFPLLASYGA